MRSTAGLLLFTALAAPSTADTVHLTNGRKLEDVVVERSAGEVRIRLPYGEIVLPDRVVASVERGASVWQEHADRERRLRQTAAPAGDWLQLALRAERSGYAAGFRSALLRAGDLDPGLEGLAAAMARIGYVLDRQAGEWLAESEYMRRRGYRAWGDVWLPQEEFAARLRAREEGEKRRREEAREERLTRAIEALVLVQLSRSARPAPPAEPEPGSGRGPLVAIYSGGFLSWAPPVVGVAPPAAVAERVDHDRPARRQPGSRSPVSPVGRQLSSSD